MIKEKMVKVPNEQIIENINELKSMSSIKKDLEIWGKEQLSNRIFFKNVQWLIDNKYAHLLATIEGIEGKDAALIWLKKNGFDLLFHFARSADSWKDSQVWLQKKDKLLYAISLKIEYVKDQIDLINEDPHKINP